MLRAVIVAAALAASTLGAQAAPPRAPSAAAQRPPAARLGNYDIELAVNGEPVQGVLTLSAAGDSLGVAIEVFGHSPTIQSIAWADPRLTVTAAFGDRQLRYELLFRADSVTGAFTMNDNEGTVRGKKRR